MSGSGARRWIATNAASSTTAIAIGTTVCGAVQPCCSICVIPSTSAPSPAVAVAAPGTSRRGTAVDRLVAEQAGRGHQHGEPDRRR